MKQINKKEILDFYKKHDSSTSPGRFGEYFKKLPSEINFLIKVVQSNLIHKYWLSRYNPISHQEILKLREIKTIKLILAKLFKYRKTSFLIENFNERKLVVTCRHFALFLCSLLRSKDVPVRIRFGFATYFSASTSKEYYEDHSICQYWDSKRKRWAYADPQLDDFQKKSLGINFDTTNLPYGKFYSAGEIWQKIIKGTIDEKNIGFSRIKGLTGGWYVGANMIKDFFALNNSPRLDFEGDNWEKYSKLFNKENKFLGQLAKITPSPDKHFDLLRNIFQNDLRNPEDAIGLIKNNKELKY